MSERDEGSLVLRSGDRRYPAERQGRGNDRGCGSTGDKVADSGSDAVAARDDFVEGDDNGGRADELKDDEEDRGWCEG